jgi:hypothetical protein
LEFIWADSRCDFRGFVVLPLDAQGTADMHLRPFEVLCGTPEDLVPPREVAGFSSIKHDPQSPLILVSFLEQGDKDFFLKKWVQKTCRHSLIKEKSHDMTKMKKKIFNKKGLHS